MGRASSSTASRSSFAATETTLNMVLRVSFPLKNLHVPLKNLHFHGFTGAPPMEKAYYTAQLTGMKALGYNFIRFHTHSMPDVFHEAADELGFLCDPEFAMNYKYPCPFPGCVTNDLVRGTFNRSFASIVHRTSHHPSL